MPYTKEEFIRTMRNICPSLPQNIFKAEEKMRQVLKTHFGINNPELMSYYGFKGDYIKYLENIWYKNQSYFLSQNPPQSSKPYQTSVPSGHYPKDRKYLMGCLVTQRQPMLDWHNIVENSKEWNNGWFSKLPYYERKYLMLVRNFEDYEKDAPDIQRFRISHIPGDVKFEECVPKINELYIAHPYKPGVYLPVSRYEHLLLRERIHEMSKVMMALGATEIRTLQNDVSKSYSKGEYSSRTSVSGGYGASFSGSGSYASDSEHSRNIESESEIAINFKNDPLKLPHLPQDLVWFDHESEWQQIAESRLNGNILEYELRLSSKQVNLVSDHERSNIEAQAKILLASGSFSREPSSSSIFKEESAKSTSILIKFKSRKEY